jgi:hypothetical protein
MRAFTTDSGVQIDEYLYSNQDKVVKSVTVYSGVVNADGDGNRVLFPGTILGKITSGGKYGPYDGSASDGRQQPAGILDTFVNAKEGDVEAGNLISGFVIEERVYIGATRPGSISAGIRAALIASGLDIKVRAFDD